MTQSRYSSNIADWMAFGTPSVAQLPQPHPGYPESPYAFDVPPTNMRDVRKTSDYGPRRSPFLGASSIHGGVDYGRKMSPGHPGKVSEKSIKGQRLDAVRPGVVTYAGRAGRAGKMVTVDHGDGLQTRYFHMDDISVAIGDRVEAGWQVGTIGSTGSSNAPHLHFEALINGEKVNPDPYLAEFENPPMPTPQRRPNSAPLGVVEVADLPQLTGPGTPTPANLPALPPMGTPMPDQLPNIPAPGNPLSLTAGPSMANVGTSAQAMLGSLAPVQMAPLQADAARANIGTSATATAELGPMLPQSIEDGPISANRGASASATAIPGSLAPISPDRIQRAFMDSERAPQLPDFMGASNKPAGLGADQISMALHGTPQLPQSVTPNARIDQAFADVPSQPDARIDQAFFDAGNIPGSLSPRIQDPVTPRMVQTESIYAQAMPQTHPGYPGQPTPEARPAYAGPSPFDNAPGIPMAMADAVPSLPEARPEYAGVPITPSQMPVARSSAVPGLPQARPEQDMALMSTNGLPNNARIDGAFGFDGSLRDLSEFVDPSQMHVNGVPMQDYVNGERSGSTIPGSLMPGSLPAIPTINSPATSIPTIGGPSGSVPTVQGAVPNIPGSLAPGMPTQFDTSPGLPSATQIAAEQQKRNNWEPTIAGVGLGAAAAILTGNPVVAAGAYNFGNRVTNGMGDLGGGFAGFGGTGTGAVEGAIQSGYAPNSAYNSSVARNNFNKTVGASDAQTQAYFDYQNAKARGSYTADGQYTGKGYGGASGVSQEAQDSIDFSGPGLF